jgi:hypothetical protein
MTQSKDFPQIQKLQGGVLIPCNVQQFENEGETGYKYTQLKMTNPGTFESYQQVIWRKLQSDLSQTIHSMYDQGEQATISGYAIKAANLSRQDIIDVCLPVQAWIDSVLEYYDTKKIEVFAASNEFELLSVAWDFSSFNSHTRVDWRAIKAMF